jgi:hypothetical protein
MYTIGTQFNSKYPIWNPQGDIIAECLNKEDAELIVNALNFKDNQYYSNSKDIVFCGTQDTATDIMDLYIDKGYSVMQSTVQITTGTHGNQVVKRLDILKR